ncbi:MAG: sugar phosphate isomerase/epimerase [Chthoniobacterales bacterium]
MPSKLAVQMYTAREHTKTSSDLAKTLRKFRDIGYEAVQLSAVGAMNGESPEVDAATARKMLDDAGLRCIATHRPLDRLMAETSAEIDFHHTLGCDYVAFGGLQGHVDTFDAYHALAKDAEALIAKLEPAGIRFGHHNHAHEFYRPERHGKTLEDVLIDETTPKLMLELDLYWIEHAGLNCVRILERCHGRVPVIHVKDKEVIAGKNDTRMAPVGEGNLDWSAILPACEAAGVDWYGVEQDECFRDPFDCLKSSFDFLTSKGL